MAMYQAKCRAWQDVEAGLGRREIIAANYIVYRSVIAWGRIKSWAILMDKSEGHER